ncbi:MAG: N-acetyltransferase [Proteobacteria bacterium]|nr:N-acetyltransferase [Pseudomonadota bacterium]
MSVARAPLASPIPANADYAVAVVRTLDEMLQVQAVRTLVYMGDQVCPYEEEFDGNDFCGATHLLLRCGREPVGVARLRWFGEFAKFERLAVRKEHRGGPGLKLLCEAAFDLAARKGYRKLIGHAQVRGEAFWKRYFKGRPRPGRPVFHFSGYAYLEMEFDLAAHAGGVGLNSPPMVLLRPEGDWDRPGVLESPGARASARDLAA